MQGHAGRPDLKQLMMRLLPCLLILGLAAGTASAREVEGVRLADTISQQGSELLLNGAGVRSKFFFDIYVIGLYLPHPSRDASAILDMPGEKRIVIHFLYKEVDRDKLVDGWQSGFEKNQSAKAMQNLQPRLDQFNAMFRSMKAGQICEFVLMADGYTVVRINDKVQGRIEGLDFQRALLQIWLGDKPVGEGLKKELCGQS